MLPAPIQLLHLTAAACCRPPAEKGKSFPPLSTTSSAKATRVSIEEEPAALRSPPSKFERKFVVGDAILPSEVDEGGFFFIPPDDEVAALEKLVTANQFIGFYGPRGIGRTTTVFQLLRRLEGLHNLQPVKLDFNIIDISGTSSQFWRSLCESLTVGALIDRSGLKIAPFDSAQSFKAAFISEGANSSDQRRLVLLMEGFDQLEYASSGIKEEFLAAFNDIRTSKALYSIKSIIGVGRNNLTFMHEGCLKGDAASVFDVYVPAVYFTKEQVEELFRQFTEATGVKLEDGIAADIHTYTGGHKGLVCICGRVMQRNEGAAKSLRSGEDGKFISLKNWLDFRARGEVLDRASLYAIFRVMVRRVPEMPEEARELLELALMMGHEQPWPLPPPVLPYVSRRSSPTSRADAAHRNSILVSAARYLITEGWLLPAPTDSYPTANGGGSEGEGLYFPSPLIRAMAMHAVMGEKRIGRTPRPFGDAWWSPSFPSGPDRKLDMAKLIAGLLPYFDRPDSFTTTIRVGSESSKKMMTLKTKVSSVPAVIAGRLSGKPVLNEGYYHFQLYWLLSRWLYHIAGDIVVDSDDGDPSSLKQPPRLLLQRENKWQPQPFAADMLLFGRRSRLEIWGLYVDHRHLLLRIVASASPREIEEHYSRCLRYIKAAAHDGDEVKQRRRTACCVVFTELPSTTDVTSIDPSTALTWPTDSQIEDDGLVAIHVLHNSKWTKARVVSRQKAGGAVHPYHNHRGLDVDLTGRRDIVVDLRRGPPAAAASSSSFSGSSSAK
jgi:hypothetical protein